MRQVETGKTGEATVTVPAARLRRVPARWLLVAAALAALAPSGSPLLAQVVFPGQVTERVVSATDSTQSYAVYLPSTYDAGRRWPIVFLMDPRGRALVPLGLFKAAAERDGYILISSYNTLSDGPAAPNVVAMNAMLSDAAATFSLDTHRYYLAGFSGTARVAWDFAEQLKQHVVGIFGASAGTAAPPPWLARGGGPPPVAFYGTAGTTDFNYPEMESFRTKLGVWNLPERFRSFPGPHSWPPEALCSAGLDWFTLQAMHHGLMATRTGFVDSLYVTDLAQADTLEQKGRALDALGRYREMLSDYVGMHDLDDVRARSSALEDSPVVGDQRKERRRVLNRFAKYSQDLYTYLERLQKQREPAKTEEVMRHLQIEELLAEAQGDSAAGYGARRMLALAFVQMSFYLPRTEMVNERPDHALPYLRVAAAIKADNPTVLLNLARAYAQAGRPDDAFDALAQAVHVGVSVGRIREDSTLVSLRADPRFEQTLRSGG